MKRVMPMTELTREVRKLVTNQGLNQARSLMATSISWYLDFFNCARMATLISTWQDQRVTGFENIIWKVLPGVLPQRRVQVSSLFPPKPAFPAGLFRHLIVSSI